MKTLQTERRGGRTTAPCSLIFIDFDIVGLLWFVLFFKYWNLRIHETANSYC